MNSDFKKIEFQNIKNPSSGFDLVSIKELLSNDYLDHSPFALHQIEFFCILFVLNGSGKHTIDFVDYECKKGTVLVLRKDQLHKFSKSSIEGVILVFTLEFLGSFYTKTEAQKSLLLFNDFLTSPKIELSENQFIVFSNLLERLREEYLAIYDQNSPSIIRSELQILISKMYRLMTQKQDIKSNKKYISEFIHFHNCVEEKFSQSLKVKDYSSWLGMSAKTLNAVTQHIIRKSAKAFIDEVCVNHIKRQLINSEASIKEISYASGFVETSNFYIYFKKRVGKTPEEFRKTCRQDSHFHTL